MLVSLKYKIHAETWCAPRSGETKPRRNVLLCLPTYSNIAFCYRIEVVSLNGANKWNRGFDPINTFFPRRLRERQSARNRFSL